MRLYDSAGQLKVVMAIGAQSNQAASAGNGSFNFETISFSNLNGISFSTSAGSAIVASHNALTSQSNQAFSADASSTFQTLTFQNSNLVSFSNNAGAIRVTHDLMASTSRPAFSADASSTFQTITFQNSNGISFSNNAGAVRLTHDLMFSTSRPAFSADASSTFQTLTFQNSNQISFSNNAGAIRVTHDLMQSTSRPAFSADASSTFQTITFQNSNGVSFSNNAGALRVTHDLAFSSQTNNTGRIYVTAQSTGQSSSSTYDLRTLSIVPDGIISAGWSAGSFRISATQSNQAFSADASSTFQTLTFQNSNLISFSNNAGAIRITHDLMASTSRPAFTAQGGSSTFQTLLFNNVNGIAWSNNTGAIQIQSISLSLFAVSNTTQSSSGTQLHTALSFGGAGAASIGVTGGSVVVSVPSVVTISSYENCVPFASNVAATLNAASISHAVAFQLPKGLSASFLRIPVVMTTGSTTLATLASATASASNQTANTWNAVVYSMGIGASSKSLQSVASGSAGATFSQRISITNSSQYSISQGVTFPMEGGADTNRTTQYSASTTNYSFDITRIGTEFSGSRFIDIKFANSLTPGPYWLVFGYSSSSASAGAGLGGMSACNVRYSNHYGASQADINFGVMGSTNLTSGGLLGAGSFSTAGGGTTNSIPISAISSSASNPRWYFQLLRSA